MTMRFRPRRFGVIAALSFALAGTSASGAAAPADGLPSTLRVVVGFPAGAGLDTVARIYADGLRQQLKISVVVENKPGAGGAIAVQTVVSAPSNPPTLLFAIDHQTSVLQHVVKNPGFDAERDLVPLGRVATYDMCLAVNSSVAARTVPEYAAAARSNASLANIAIPALGSNSQFIAHVIANYYGIKAVPVPYRGGAQAVNDLIGGQIKVAVMPCSAFTAFVEAGTVRILAIAADARSAQFPDVPALNEFGVRVPASNNFLAVYATRSMDPKLVATLVAATRDMLKDPVIVDRLNVPGRFANYASPEYIARFAREASAFWAAQVKSSGYVAD